MPLNIPVSEEAAVEVVNKSTDAAQDQHEAKPDPEVAEYIFYKIHSSAN